MSKIIKGNTHLVIKRDDIYKYLTMTEQFIFETLVDAINNGRKKDGKKLNSYAICNQDEPYYDKVLKQILKGEGKKK